MSTLRIRVLPCTPGTSRLSQRHSVWVSLPTSVPRARVVGRGTRAVAVEVTDSQAAGKTVSSVGDGLGFASGDVVAVGYGWATTSGCLAFQSARFSAMILTRWVTSRIAFSSVIDWTVSLLRIW